jgi:hypothetical protein
MLGSKALEIAISKLGVHEDPPGSNSGLEINKYLANVGLPPNNCWCMAFVFTCFAEAANTLGVPNPLFKTGSCMVQKNMRKANIVTVPQPGDIFILDLGEGKGHTGLVKDVNIASGRFNTVEGNSNTNGSRDGEEVCSKPNGRPITSVAAFLRF